MGSEQLEKLKLRIPYNEHIFVSEQDYEETLKILLEDSKDKALLTLYPFKDTYGLALPRKYWNWQIRCCVELWNMGDKMGVKSYSENGLSFTRFTDGISNELMSELMPSIGVGRG